MHLPVCWPQGQLRGPVQRGTLLTASLRLPMNGTMRCPISVHTPIKCKNMLQAVCSAPPNAGYRNSLPRTMNTTIISVAALALSALCSSASAQSIYTKAGLLGAGVGYGQAVNSNLGLRADWTTIGNHDKEGTSGDFDYNGKLKFDQTSLYADWFPFAGTFRVTGGVNLRNAHLTADARPNQLGSVTIGDTTVGFGAQDQVTAKVELPKVAPYLGIGWGHNMAVQKPGFSMFVDLGLSFGKPKVSLQVSDSVRDKLNQDPSNPNRAQQEIDKQIQTIADDSDKIKVFPQLYIGVAYKF